MYYIYGLVKNNRVVYVGQSKSLKSRVRAHRRSEKEFDDYVILDECEYKNNELEDSYIVKHEPIYNKALNKYGHVLTVKEIFESHDNWLKFGGIENIYECIIRLGIKPVFGNRYKQRDIDKVLMEFSHGDTIEKRILNYTYVYRKELVGIV